jgi:hypothetical protein
MKTTNFKFIAGCIILFIILSCSKEQDAMTYKTTLLCQREWKFEAHGLDENNDGVIEQSENRMFPCEADDIFSFKANCTGVFTGGTMPCTVDEPSIIDFYWRFINHGTELAVFGAPEMINRLDENILEVYSMDEDTLGRPAKYIRRFRH